MWTADALSESRIEQDHEHRQHIPTCALFLARGAAYAKPFLHLRRRMRPAASTKLREGRSGQII
jgi:hypothetical protein